MYKKKKEKERGQKKKSVRQKVRRGVKLLKNKTQNLMGARVRVYVCVCVHARDEGAESGQVGVGDEEEEE